VGNEGCERIGTRGDRSVTKFTPVVSETLYDRFKKEVKEFRTEDRISKSRSGVEEIFDEKTQLLEDICLQMDDESGRLADERNQKTKTDQALTSAGPR
jgi:hypothetical protein